MLLGIAGDGSGQVELGMTNTTMNKGKGQQSRRDRAYSVSDSSYVFPLPTTMFTSAIFKALALPQRHVYLRDELIDTVLRKQSWAVNIFSKLDSKTKSNIATSLLTLKTEGGVVGAGQAFLNLPLEVASVVELLKTTKKLKENNITIINNNSNNNLGRVALLAEWVKTRGGEIGGEGEGEYDGSVVEVLFGQLSALSEKEDDSSEFTSFCLMDALLSILVNANANANTNTFVKNSTSTKKVNERSERAFWKTRRILAMKCAKWLQTATSPTRLTHPIQFVWLASFVLLLLH